MTDLGGSVSVIGPQGTDTLFSIEHLQFSDGTITPGNYGVLFDTAFYLSHNPDVLHAGVNALDHFNTFGWREGRDPNEFFSTNFYLGANPDARAAGVNPLGHYHTTGWKNGYDPGPNFDTGLYLSNNPDVAAAGIDPLEHFLLSGRAEGRVAYAAIGNIVGGFDAQYYLQHNPDVAAAHVDPLLHFNVDRLARGAQPERAVRYHGLSGAPIPTSRPRTSTRSTTTSGRRLDRRPRSLGRLRHAPLSRGLCRTSRGRAHRTRSTISSSPASHEGRSAFADGAWG